MYVIFSIQISIFFYDGYACETSSFLYFRMTGIYGDCYYSKVRNKLYYGAYWKGMEKRLVYNRPFTTYKDYFVGIIQPQDNSQFFKIP